MRTIPISWDNSHWPAGHSLSLNVLKMTKIQVGSGKATQGHLQLQPQNL